MRKLEEENLELRRNLVELFEAMKKQALEIEGLKKLRPPILWSGGSTQHGNASGYNKYRTDGTDFCKAQDYFTVGKDGTFVALRSGYYRIKESST